jgi:hypothetical protein
MLVHLSAQVRECLEHAEAWAHRAKVEPDPAVQRDFIEMERCWLQMARSYQRLEQMQLLPTVQQQRGQLSNRLDQLKRELSQQR